MKFLKKQTILFLVMVIGLLFLIGCNNNSNNSPSNEQVNPISSNNEMTVTPPNDEIVSIPSNNNDSKNVEEKSDSDVSNHMKKCTTPMTSAKITYYIASDKLYSGTETQNGGKIIRIIDKNEICVWMVNEKKWNCVPNTQEDFNSELRTISSQITGDMAAFMHFTCEEVEYDDEIFNTEPRLS